MLSCRIVIFITREHRLPISKGSVLSHMHLNGHLRSGPPAPVTVMLHTGYYFILNRTTLSMKCSSLMAFAHTMMRTAYRYRNISKYIPWLYLLVKSLHQQCHNLLWHNFHLRKPIDLIDKPLIDQSAKTAAVNAKTLERPIRVEMPWGDHSCQHQWHQTNSQWHFCQ